MCILPIYFKSSCVTSCDVAFIVYSLYYKSTAALSCKINYIIGTCEASRFDSNRMIPIRLESDGLIPNFRFSRTCRRTTNHVHCSTKNNRCAIVIEIYFMFIILCLCSKSKHTCYHCRSDCAILRNQ